MSAILEAKEQLYRLQQELLQEGPVLVQAGLNMPGGYMLYPWSRLFDAVKRRIKDYLDKSGVTIITEYELKTPMGPYYLLLSGAEAMRLKSKMVILEETDPCGRLWDIDVITPSGPIDRQVLGLLPRKCLVCEGSAHECRKLQLHAQADVIAAAQKLAARVGEED